MEFESDLKCEDGEASGLFLSRITSFSSLHFPFDCSLRSLSPSLCQFDRWTRDSPLSSEYERRSLCGIDDVMGV